MPSIFDEIDDIKSFISSVQIPKFIFSFLSLEKLCQLEKEASETFNNKDMSKLKHELSSLFRRLHDDITINHAYIKQNYPEKMDSVYDLIDLLLSNEINAGNLATLKERLKRLEDIETSPVTN